MRLHAKVIRHGNRDVKVVLRYQERGEEPIYLGKLTMRPAVWAQLRLILPGLQVDETSTVLALP